MSPTVRNSIIIVIALIIIVLVTSPRISLFKGEEKTASAALDVRLPVDVVVVQEHDEENRIFSSGTILANEEVEIRSEIAGQVTKIYFTEGTTVNKGNLLLKTNDDELRAQLSKQELLKSLADDIFKRRKQLHESNLISSEEFDKAKNDLQSIESEIQLIKAKILKTELRAPFDGIIGLRYVSEGSFVNSNTRIATLQNLTSVKIDFAIPEKYATKVKKGQTVYFSVVGYEKQFTGKIYAVEPKIDPTTRTVQLRAIASNELGLLVPGSFAQVELILETINNAIMLPSESVIPELQGQKVYVVKEGKAIPVPVKSGLRTETKLQITSGLSSGDTVIVTGIMQLRPMAAVKINSVKN